MRHSPRSYAFKLLTRVGCASPGVLGDLHDRLLDQNIIDEVVGLNGVVFHGAAAAVRDRLLGLASGIDEGQRPTNLLVALAWVGDDVVRDTFAGWSADPPSWAAACSADPGSWLSWFPTDAGWTVGGDGTRRGLYRSPCRAMTATGDEEAASVGGPFDESCPWCGHVLTVLLDLDLAHPDTGFIGIAGRRLRLPTCEFCVCYSTLYMEIDQEGGARWADSNERPPYLPPPDTAAPDEDRMPAGLRSLGELRASPFLTMAFPHDETSQLGGLATWVQDADFPPCPKCGELMPFIGQVDTSVVAWGEGTIYAFVDAGCGTAATSYQQT